MSSSLICTNMKIHLVKSLSLLFFSFNCIVFRCLNSESKRRMNVAFNDCLRYIHSLPRHLNVARHKNSLLCMSLDKYYEFRSIFKLHNIVHKDCPTYLYDYVNFLQSLSYLIYLSEMSFLPK